ncbi:hypothetical protein ACIB24_16245 [Spongisporangium articulatum]|uniref:Uncharacterized protein n=1 Tax=Spongisporangium articulatum TaxID=3362603 RepID=A0ABW8ARV8_9ACTN
MTDLGEPAVRSDRRPRPFAIATGTVVLAAALGQLAPGGYIAWRWAFGHGYADLALAGVLAIPAVGLRKTARWWTTSLKVVGLTLSGLALVFGLYGALCLSWLGGHFHLARTSPAPHRPYTLRVYEGDYVLDQVWQLSIRSGSGPTSREWVFGCLLGDDAYNAFTSAEWLDAGHIVVMTSDPTRRHVVTVDGNGHPHGRVGTYGGC